MSPEEREILIRVDTNVKHMMQEFLGHVKHDNERFEKHDIRINKLAGRQNWMLGIGAGIVGVVGVIGLILKLLEIAAS